MDKGQTYSYSDVKFLEDMAEVYGRNQGRQEECARIRKELLAEIEDLTVSVEWTDADSGSTSVRVDDPYVSASELRAALDRICPE